MKKFYIVTMLSLITFQALNFETAVNADTTDFKTETVSKKYNKHSSNKEKKEFNKKVDKKVKNNDMYKCLNQNKNQSVQKLTLFYNNKNNIPDGLVQTNNKNNRQDFYIVGTPEQLDQAINDLNNYSKNENSIVLLTNTSNVKIFNAEFEKIDNPLEMYQDGEKIGIDNSRISKKEIENKITSTIENQQLGVDLSENLKADSKEY